MDTQENSSNGEKIIIAYIDNEISEDGYILRKNKNEQGTVGPSHGLVNRVSDLLNNPDYFLEYTNFNGTESIISKRAIIYVAQEGAKDLTILNTDSQYTTIELNNGQKFRGEIFLGGTIKIRHLFENKMFIALSQVNINRTLLINRECIKKIEK